MTEPALVPPGRAGRIESPSRRNTSESTAHDVGGEAPAYVSERRRALRTAAGAAPACLLAAVVTWWLHRYGVTAKDLAVFTGYLTAGIVLPGTLLFRALTGRRRCLAEDLAGGTALGYGIEVLTYIPARWAGAPRLFLIWPVVTIAAFLLVPALRRHWRGGGVRMPWWWSWSLASIVGFVILAGSAAFFHAHGLTSPGNRLPDVHSTFNLALATEVAHHMPPAVPWVTGEPLSYHWFVYADIAATHWATGIDTAVLLFRLSLLPMVAAFPVLLAAIAHRLSGRLWAGLGALGITYFAVSPAPAAWPALLDTYLLSQRNRFVWLSPSQTFATVLFAALVLVLVELLKRRGPAVTAPLCAAAILTAAVMGAKATFLPMLLCGLAGVAATRVLLRRRVGLAVPVMLGWTALCLAFAQFVIFGGASQGMRIEPGETLRFVADRTRTSEAIALLVMLLGWACAMSGLAGLAWPAWPAGAVQSARPGRPVGPAGPATRRRRPATGSGVVLVAIIGLAGIGALLVFSALGVSQFYFPRGSIPYLGVAAACGAAALFPVPARRRSGRHGHRRPGRQAVIPVCAAAGGAGLALGLPTEGSPMPFIALFPAVMAVCAVLGAVRTRLGHVLPVTVIVLTALTVPAGARQIAEDISVTVSPARSGYSGGVPISQGAHAVARWLRRNSRPGDLVATNAHCVSPTPGRCNNQRMWIAALTERRVLVEGWGFTETANSMGAPNEYPFTPFWDAQRLADNDAAFRSPSAQTVGRLRQVYGVRWLFADARAGGLSPALASVATLRFHRGACAVYEIGGGTPRRPDDIQAGIR